MLKSGIYDFVICRGGTDMCFVLGFGRQRLDLKQYRISGLTPTCCTLSTMGKKGDPKVLILPSRTRRGTALSTSAKLDSPSVMSKFDSPQLHATSAESGYMSDTFDDAFTTFETTGSLGSFIEEQI